MSPWVLVLALAVSAEDLALYRHWCARCHGENGDGRGLAALSLALNGTPPRDFTRALFKFKSTPPGAAPSDQDLKRVIRDGLAASPMPSFGDLLSEGELDRLVGVVRSFARRHLPEAPPLDLGSGVAEEEPARQRGRALYLALGCGDCHGADGRGADSPRSELRNDDGSKALPADLGRPWTFRGGADARALVTRLATGLAGTPMPSYLGAVPIEDLWSVAHYVRSLAVAPSLREAAIGRAKEAPGEGEPLVRRGEYLAKSGTCFLCHVQMNPDGSYAEGSFGAGGMRIEIKTVGTVYSRNLTPDVETGIGGWTVDDFRAAVRDGRSRGGRRLNALDMPWTILAGMTDRDLEAIHAYLKTLPPVRNRVPPPESAGCRGGLVEKIGVLWRGEQIKAGFFPGNAGAIPERAASPEVSNPRVDIVVPFACVLVILVAILRRTPGALAAGGVAIAIAAVYTWPPLRFLPAALLKAEAPYRAVAEVMNLPPLRPPPAPGAIANGDERALAERGRYVATVGTCSLCHTAGPNVTRLYAPFPEMGGGMKVNWKVFGTTYSRNLTPDRETGLGAWSDEEIRRAITSGIARDGRLMHWQAMPWDHFANLSPEDLTALVSYLRHLPPAWSRVPMPEPPAASDEEGDTFYFGYTGEYREERG